MYSGALRNPYRFRYDGIQRQRETQYLCARDRAVSGSGTDDTVQNRSQAAVTAACMRCMHFDHVNARLSSLIAARSAGETFWKPSSPPADSATLQARTTVIVCSELNISGETNNFTAAT